MSTMTRRGRLLALVASLLAALLFQPTFASATMNVAIEGSGWGHGVGLSQYGAKAMGADGATYEEIIARYFKGVSIVPVSAAAPGSFVDTDPAPLWVGLLQDSPTVVFSLESDGGQLCFVEASSCHMTVMPGVDLRFPPDGLGGCVLLAIDSSGRTDSLSRSGSCNASIRPLSDRTIVNIPFKARSYRGGVVHFRSGTTPSYLNVIHEVGIDDYLKGISEVPESWPLETIKAQVVVSRSYALRRALDRGGIASLDPGWKSDCDCNLKDDSSDQVYRGWTGELSHPNWVAAVESTARLVMSNSGTVALGLYSSSSGGSTENYVDVFGEDGHPYLTTVFDSPSMSDSANNPHASWAATYDQAVLAELFGFQWVSGVEVIERNESGSARTLQIAGIIGGRPESITVGGVEFRDSLSLRSTTFGVAVALPFSDVSRSDPFVGEVIGLNALAVTNGCTETTYCPNDPVTRAEMAAFLVRALDIDQYLDSGAFRDDDGHPLESEIATFHHHGLTNGCTETTYCPNDPVTRAEMAAFLVRGFALDESDTDPFSDDNGAFFEEEISALHASGITSGCTPTTYCPNDPVTRAEMAAFIIRALAH